MSPDRLRAILSLSGPFQTLRFAFPKKRYENDLIGELPTPGGITEEEHYKILAQWDMLPGHYSYHDALVSLATGSISAGLPN